MQPTDTPDSWSIHEALAVAYGAFTERFGATILWQAFVALTRDRDATLAEQERLEADIDSFIKYPLGMKGSKLDVWVASALADPEVALLVLHMGVRWWRARDDLLTRPAASRVPCVYEEGGLEHVSLQLLRQMLYRGRAPYTTCD